MRTATQLLISAAVGLSAFAGAANAAELRQIGTISIPGAPLNSFDISWIDQSTGMYYLADRSNKGIDIIDTKKHAWVGRIAGKRRPCRACLRCDHRWRGGGLRWLRRGGFRAPAQSRAQWASVSMDVRSARARRRGFATESAA